MIIKVFYKDNSVGIYDIYEFKYNASTQDIILVHANDEEPLDRNKIKNYTIYTDNGQQIHTTYSKKNYKQEPAGW
jgi:hypothetical protein